MVDFKKLGKRKEKEGRKGERERKEKGMYGVLQHLHKKWTQN